MTIYDFGKARALQKLGMIMPTQLLGKNTVRGMQTQAKRKVGKLQRTIKRNPLKATAAAGAAGVGTGIAMTGSSVQKHAFLGPLTELSGTGTPSLLGYAAGRNTAPSGQADAQREAAKKYSILKALMIPGYTGYHHGTKQRAQDYLDANQAPSD